MGDGILFRFRQRDESCYFGDLGVDSVLRGDEAFYACEDGGVDYRDLLGGGECCDGGNDCVLVFEGGEEGGRGVVCFVDCDVGREGGGGGLAGKD